MLKVLSSFYKNHRGEVRWRVIEPIEIWFGHTEWHKEDQYLLKAKDTVDGVIKDFALKDFLGQDYHTPIQEKEEVKSLIDEELREISERAKALGFQVVSNEQADVLGVSIGVGAGLYVYGTVAAIGRVQNYILMTSKHPIEERDTNRSLMRQLEEAEAMIGALNHKLQELTNILVNTTK